MASVRQAVSRGVTRGKSYSRQPVHAPILYESGVTALLVLDLSGRIRYLNHAASEMLGVSLEQARGSAWMNCVNIVDGKTRVPIRYPVGSYLDSGKPAKVGFDAVLISALGMDIPVDVHVEPFAELDDAVIGALVMFRDLSGASARRS